MATLTSRLVVAILDQATRPARQISAAIRGIARATREANREQLTAFAQRQRQQARQLQGQLVGTAAAAAGLGYALNRPRAAARDFQTQLTDIQQKAGLSDAAVAALGRRVRRLGPEVNQTASEVARSIDTLMGFGLDAGAAEAMTRPIGKAATAYNAATEDLAAATFAVVDNLQVPAEQTAKALDVMAQAGKDGAVELKDMATAFPGLTAGARGLGETGVAAVADLAAALEIARKGAASADEAATNIANLQQKIMAPQTRKAFAAMGVDLEGSLKAAKAAGQSSIEAITSITNKALGGDLSRLGDLFQDAQVQKALRPLIQNLEEFRQLRRRAFEASGGVDADFAKRMETDAAKEKLVAVNALEAAIALGGSLRPAFAAVFNVITPVLNLVGQLIERHPVLTRFVIGTTVALVGLRLAMLATRFAKAQFLATLAEMGLGLIGARTRLGAISTFLFGPFIRAHQRAGVQMALMRAEMAGTATAGAIARAGFGVYARALLGLLNPMRLVSVATNLLKLSVRGLMAATGVGLLIVAASLIVEHWRGVVTFFQGFGRGFMAALAPVAPALKPLIDLIKGVVGWVARLFGGKEGEDWSKFGEIAGRAIGGVVAAIAQLIGLLVTAIAKVGEFWDRWNNRGRLSRQMVPVDDMRRFANQGLVPPDQMQAWRDSAGQIPGRRNGGYVSAGQIYQIEEDEVFRPGRSGTVIPSREAAKLGGGRGAITIQQSFRNTYQIQGATAAEVIAQIEARQRAQQAEAARGAYADFDIRSD
jgi:TP901 family phage tail tape measure protein